MSLIYEPSGKAREYSPLAFNLYNGCSHQCSYCYNRNYLGVSSEVTPKKNVLMLLEKELQKVTPSVQVLLSFVSDIYCDGTDITRQALKILLVYQVPIAILTKNKKVVRDIDLFKQFEQIKVGMTLTFIEDNDSLKYEPGASLPQERFEALKELHQAGIKTFASLEPVIAPVQTLEIIDRTKDFVDMFKIGKLNHSKQIENTIDWNDFGQKAVKKCIEYDKDFYVKKDLLALMKDKSMLMSKNINADYWALKKTTVVMKQGELF